MKKVISFALFGKKEMYLKGMIENAKLCKKYYSDWVCRVYIARDVPTEIILQLAHLDVEIFYHNAIPIDFKAQWVRMEVMLDKTVSKFMIRDADSRINLREVEAVKEWEQTDKMVHIMRDHKKHTAPMMGGMWGAVQGFIPRDELEKLYDASVKHVRSGKSKGKKYYKKNGLSDQGFLGNIIWPLVKSTTIHMAHDDQKRFTKQERKFKIKLINKKFVGQQVDGNGKYINVN